MPRETIRDPEKKGRRLRAKPITDEFFEKHAEQVEKLAGIGCTDEEIAYILKIDDHPLKQHFRNELDHGRANLRGNIRKAQIKKAIEERCTKMLIWLGKMYLGQREPKHEVEHTGNMKIQPMYYGEVAAKEAEERNPDS